MADEEKGCGWKVGGLVVVVMMLVVGVVVARAEGRG